MVGSFVLSSGFYDAYYKKAQKVRTLIRHDVFPRPASLAGLPGLTVPAGYAAPSDDASISLPVGLQILGPVLGEEKCLMVGHIFEQAMKNLIENKKPAIW